MLCVQWLAKAQHAHGFISSDGIVKHDTVCFIHHLWRPHLLLLLFLLSEAMASWCQWWFTQQDLSSTWFKEDGFCASVTESYTKWHVTFHHKCIFSQLGTRGLHVFSWCPLLVKHKGSCLGSTCVSKAGGVVGGGGGGGPDVYGRRHNSIRSLCFHPPYWNALL